MAYKLVMVSEEYGREEFEYPTRQEAEAGQERIEAKARKLRDGVERFFSIKRTR
jgi:hypothetical protein